MLSRITKKAVSLSLVPFACSWLFFTSPNVDACGFHGQHNLDIEVPGTMQIFFKSHNAIRKGIIKEPALINPNAAFQRAAWWMKLTAKKMKASGLPPSHIFLVDATLWANFQPNNPSRMLSIDVAPPQKGQLVTLLTHASLAAIANNTLTIDEAIKQKLLVEVTV